jgi:hypothetical protein
LLKHGNRLNQEFPLEFTTYQDFVFAFCNVRVDDPKAVGPLHYAGYPWHARHAIPAQHAGHALGLDTANKAKLRGKCVLSFTVQMEEPPLTDYEMQREALIARNRAR